MSPKKEEMTHDVRSLVQFTLDRPCMQPHGVQMDKWEATIAPGTQSLILKSPEVFEPANLPQAAFEAAQKALDVLSVGAGAYAIPNPRTGRLVWWRGADGGHLRLTEEVAIQMPFGIITMTAGAGESSSSPGMRGRSKYNDALRYFRMAQLSSDVFAAFHHMFLCFERLLSERVEPLVLEKGKREPEAQWIRRALGIVVPTYANPPAIGSRPDFWEKFPNEVYQNVRCRMFHAKAKRPNILPSNPADVAKVEWAFQIVTEHVLELARPFLGFSATARPLMDHELATSGGYIGPAPLLNLICEEEGGRTAEIPLTCERANKAEPGIASFFASTPVDATLAGTCVSRLRLQAPLFPTEILLAGRFPMAEVQHFEVELAANFRMEQNIRTIFGRRG